jgi:hypothetical protein
MSLQVLLRLCVDDAGEQYWHGEDCESNSIDENL